MEGSGGQAPEGEPCCGVFGDNGKFVNPASRALAHSYLQSLLNKLSIPSATGHRSTLALLAGTDICFRACWAATFLVNGQLKAQLPYQFAACLMNLFVNLTNSEIDISCK